MDIRRPRRARNTVRTAGFTLLELLITLAIAAILLTLVAPAFAQLIASTRITTAINELLTTIHVTRSEAIKRTTRVALCPSADGLTCLDIPAWEQGWVAFVDGNRDRNLDAGELVLRQHPGFGTQLSIRSGTRTRIVYDADGLAVGGLNGTYTFCDAGDTAPPKALILSNPGRARVSSTKSSGAALDCP